MIPEIGVLQEQRRELLLGAHELPDIVFDFKARMNHCPIMGCSDERQKREQILDTLRTKGSPQHLAGALGLRWFDKHQRGSGKDPVLNLAVRGGPIDGLFDGCQACINRLELSPPRRRRLEKLERLLDALWRSRSIAR